MTVVGWRQRQRSCRRRYCVCVGAVQLVLLSLPCFCLLTSVGSTLGEHRRDVAVSANLNPHVRSALPSTADFWTWASTTPDSVDNTTTPSPSPLGCAVAVFLHIPKTGGTTLSEDVFEVWRNAFGFRTFRYRLSPAVNEGGTRPAAVLGDSTLARSSDLSPSQSSFGLHTRMSWEQLTSQLVDIGNSTAFSNQDLRSLRVAIELHFCLGLRTTAEALHKIRASLEPRGCNVKTLTLLREPFDHQLSWLGTFRCACR